MYFRQKKSYHRWKVRGAGRNEEITSKENVNFMRKKIIKKIAMLMLIMMMTMMCVAHTGI